MNDAATQTTTQTSTTGSAQSSSAPTPTATTTEPTTTQASAPQPNTDAARTPDGTLKDQSASQPQGVPDVVDPKAADGAKPDASANPAPESYTEFKLPEGVTLDPAVLERATPIFRELGLDQAKAQQLVTLQAELMKQTAERAAQQVSEMREAWRAEVKADKDIGPRLDKVLENIGRAKAHLPPDIRAAFDADMNFTGAGDKLGFVKAINHWANMVNEGSHVAGAGPSPHGQNGKGQASRPTPAQAMYPNLPSANRPN